MKKRIRCLCLLVLLVIMTLPVEVFATDTGPNNQSFEFTFTNLYNFQTSPTRKLSEEQRWYLSLDAVNRDSGAFNNLSASNIFGCRMNQQNVNYTYISYYHTFSNYVSGYPLEYTKNIPLNTYVYLGVKKDSDSTSSSPLRISGRYCP